MHAPVRAGRSELIARQVRRATVSPMPTPHHAPTTTLVRRSDGVRHAYTLAETVVVLGLILLTLSMVVVGARTWLTAQRSDRVAATLQASVVAQEVHHGRFGSFTASPSQLGAALGEVAVVSESTSSDEVAVALGTYDDTVHGTTDAVVLGVADGPTCTWTRVPDLEVRAPRASGQFDGVCEVSALLGAAGMSP